MAQQGNVLTDDDLAAMRARLDAASPGPWGWWDVADGSAGWDGPDMVRHGGPGRSLAGRRDWGMSSEDRTFDFSSAVLYFPDGAQTPTAEDATFIAHARTDMGRLLDEVAALRAQLARVRQALS